MSDYDLLRKKIRDEQVTKENLAQTKDTELLPCLQRCGDTRHNGPCKPRPK
jgi:hypothetical protein